MAGLRCAATPTEAEILAYNNVPLELAAAYIGISAIKVRDGLKQGRAPYGYAVKSEESSTWTYHISPGALVKYKKGELKMWPQDELIKRIVDEVETLLNLRAKAAVETLCPGLLEAAMQNKPSTVKK